MLTFAENIKARFAWDVTALDPYTDAQSTQFIEDLIDSSLFLSRVARMENNKGSEFIKLLESDPAVQSAAACGWTPQDGVIFTDETLNTVRLKIQEEYCNEDLNGTWAQLLNAAGANRQDQSMVMEQVIKAYYMKKTQKKIQDLVINGDTASANPDLVHFNGVRKQLINSTTVVIADVTSLATITSANAFDALIIVEEAIPDVVRDSGVAHEIVVDRAIARACLTQIYNDKDYAAEVASRTDEAGELSFILPTTNTVVRSYPQLNGTGEAYVWVYDYIVYGTDLDGDENGFEMKYNDTDEKLRVGTKWRSGVKVILQDMFVKMHRTLS
jgi:hypothetical protein